jgi:hypothetical protein
MLALIISMWTNTLIIHSNRNYMANLTQSLASLMQKQTKYIYACTTKCWSINSGNNQWCCRTLYMLPIFIIIVGLAMLGLWCLTSLSTIFQSSWRSFLLVKETGVSGENHRPFTCHWQTLSHHVVSRTPSHKWDSNSQF